MRLAIFTSNQIRHIHFANELSNQVDECLVVSECVKNDNMISDKGQIEALTEIEKHFLERNQVESEFFSDRIFSKGANILPLLRKEANLLHVYDIVKGFMPDLMLCFGASIIREPLLTLLPPGNFVNLHLGISPFYRGAGTNFWPFVNNELEYVGATLLHIDAGIDTGDIIAHVRPEYVKGDTVHTVGCKVIRESIVALNKIINLKSQGKALNRVKQWEFKDKRYYKSSDFNENILMEYKENIQNGIVDAYISAPKKEIKLISL